MAGTHPGGTAQCSLGSMPGQPHGDWLCKDQPEDACCRRLSKAYRWGTKRSAVPLGGHANTQPALRAHYVASIAGVDQLRGWYVRRVAGGETSPVEGRYIETATWKIQGFMALDDDAASEIQFDLLVDAVRDAFRDDATIGGAVVFTAFGQQAGAQLKDAGPVMFTGVLCHAATLTLTTTRYYQSS